MAPEAGWKETTLGSVATWLSGGTPPKSNRAFWGGEIPWVSPKDMKSFRLSSTQDTVTARGVEVGTRTVPNGSVFLVVRGMILAHTFPVCVAGRTMAFNQDVKALVPAPDVNGQFLGHWFVGHAHEMLGLVTESTHGTKRIDLADLTRFSTCLPTPEEQVRIAEVLDTIDDAIRETQQVIAKLKQVKRGLLHDLLTRGIGDNGEIRDPELHPEQFKDSPIGRLPRQWSVAEMASITDSSVDGPFGSSVKTEHYVDRPGVRLVRLQNIGHGEFLDVEKSWISEAHARRLAKHNVLGGDLLIASLGDPNHDFARGCVYPRDNAPGIVKADCFRFRLTNKALADFYAKVLTEPHWRRGWAGHARRSGASRDRINLSVVRSLLVPVPPPDEQRAVVRLIEAQEHRVVAEKCAIGTLRLLKKGLMDDLLTGRVRVPVSR